MYIYLCEGMPSKQVLMEAQSFESQQSWRYRYSYESPSVDVGKQTQKCSFQLNPSLALVYCSVWKTNEQRQV